MSKTAEELRFTLGWRMRLAMEQAGVDASAMAPQLHVNRQTLGRWIRDKSVPNPILLERFAELCDVPYEWLAHGTVDGASTMWYGDGAPKDAQTGRKTQRWVYNAPCSLVGGK